MILHYDDGAGYELEYQSVASFEEKSVKFEESVPKSNPYWLRLFRCFLSKHLKSWFDQVNVSQF